MALSNGSAGASSKLQALSTMLGRFFYFSADDIERARDAWQSLVSELGIAEAEREGIIPSTSLPHIVKFKGNGAFFLIHQKIICIGACMRAELGKARIDEKSDLADILNSNPLELSSQHSIGSSTVLAADLTRIADVVENTYDETATANFTENARFIPLKLDGRSHLFAYILGDEDPIPFFVGPFVAIDATLHKLEITSPFFAENTGAALEAKRNVDDEVARILNDDRNLTGQEGEIEALETDVQRLAEMYAHLASHLSVISRSCDSFEKDVSVLSVELDAQDADPKAFGLKDFEVKLGEMKEAAMELSRSLRAVRAALTVVSTKVDLLRSKEYIALQKEALSLQVAAGFIEFILLFYYSIHTWETLAGLERFERIPTAERSALVFALSALVVGLTHQISKVLRHEANSRLPAALMLVAALVVVALMTAAALAAGAH